MALHRDIYWVGRQWAVTGYGMQAVDQKLKGQFDIEASAPVEPPKPPAQKFNMRVIGWPAKFLPPWRARSATVPPGPLRAGE